MKFDLLQAAVNETKLELETVIANAKYNNNKYSNGLVAKEALIRSQNLILKFHEVVKVSLLDEISKYRTDFNIFPPIGSRSPEMSVYGLLKMKKQDVVVLFDDVPRNRSQITEGPLSGSFDPIGREKSEKSIVIGVRSQLSSVAKNFDTLMERTFAETLNLRLRLPNLVMGDVYLLPVVEYDDGLMKQNRVGFKNDIIKVEKFISTFLAISNRPFTRFDPEIYKYERVALILVDFRKNPPKIILSTDELRSGGFISSNFQKRYESLSPVNFVQDIFEIYKKRHSS
jgi:hypothetical protein